MDDVLIVIALLLFGSSLFCLCCYKVSNLLYMLYHIDDADSLVGDTSTAAVAVSSVAAAPLAITTPPKPTPVSPDGAPAQQVYKNNGSVTTGSGPSSIYANMNHFSRKPLSDASNYQHLVRRSSPSFEGRGTSTSLLTLIPSSSSTSLANKTKSLQKTGSVTSLSIGIQCNPRDVDCLEDQDSDLGRLQSPLRMTSLNQLAINQPSITSQRSVVHLSAPDFSHAPDLASNLSHHHHHHHHLGLHRTPYQFKPPGNNIMNAVRPRTGTSDYFLAAASVAASASCHRHHHNEYSAVPGRGYLNYHTASLGRMSAQEPVMGCKVSRPHFISSPLSDSDPDISNPRVWETLNPPLPTAATTTQPQPHPHKHNQVKSPRLSSTRGPTRRYGSIRVAECSFIEHPDSSTTSPICDPRTSSTPPSSRKSSTGSKQQHSRHHTVTQINYVPSPFDRFQPVSDDDSPEELSAQTYSNVYIPKGFAALANQNAQRDDQENGQGNGCQRNGPKSVGIAAFSANNNRGLVQDIIPPPHDFGGETSSSASQQQNNKKQPRKNF